MVAILTEMLRPVDKLGVKVVFYESPMRFRAAELSRVGIKSLKVGRLVRRQTFDKNHLSIGQIRHPWQCILVTVKSKMHPHLHTKDNRGLFCSPVPGAGPSLPDSNNPCYIG